MRINVYIDEELMRKAMQAAGLRTKTATVEKALKGLVERQERREALGALWGIGWRGNLDEMRDGRDFDGISHP